MSEHGNEPSEFSPDDQDFQREKRRIYAALNQAIYDAIYQIGGDEAMAFVADMHMDLGTDEASMPTLELLRDIDQLFPGFREILRDKWIPLLEEGEMLAQRETRRIQAAKDREALQRYEDTEDFEQ